jgi:hypothetical protein
LWFAAGQPSGSSWNTLHNSGYGLNRRILDASFQEFRHHSTRMYDAFDTVRNQRVRAANATASRFPARYLCPVCRSEVYYAAGEQSPHFRHLPGNEHDDCERYAKNFHQDVPLSQHEYEHLDAVLVATQILTQQGTLVSFAVRFRPKYQAGFVHFISGEKSTPYTIHSNLRDQFFQISAPEKNYLVKAQLTGRDHELHIVEGFDETPAIFRATDQEAVRIAKHRTLKPGGHIVVSRKPIPDFHASLGSQTLHTLRGLHAALIQIPENPNWQVRENVRALLHFEITAKVAVYGFLSPSSAYELAPDCWEVSKDAELAILVRVSRQDGPKFSRFLVQHRLSGHLTTDYLAWNDNQNEFVIQFKPGFLSPELFRIGLATSVDNQVWFLLEINFSDDVVSPQCARIQFQFASATNDKSRLKWSAHELPKMLMDATRGAGTLNSITHKPKAVEICVSDSHGRRVTIPEASAAEKLLSFLRQARFPCVLSASGHPDIVLQREKRAAVQIRQAEKFVDIAPSCRRHARLLSAFNRGLVSSYSMRSIAS